MENNNHFYQYGNNDAETHMDPGFMEQARREFEELSKRDLYEAEPSAETEAAFAQLARERQAQSEEAKRRREEAALEAEQRRIHKAMEARDSSMERGAVLAAIIFIAAMYSARWALSSESISGLVRLLIQFVTIAATAISCCALLLLFMGSISSALTVLGGIAGFIGGIVMVTLYEYPDIYRKVTYAVLAIAALSVIKIIIKLFKPKTY